MSKKQIFIEAFDGTKFTIEQAKEFCLLNGLINSDEERAMRFYHKYQTRNLIKACKGGNNQRLFLSYSAGRNDYYTSVESEKKTIRLKGVCRKLYKNLKGTRKTYAYAKGKYKNSKQIEGQLSLSEILLKPAKEPAGV